MAIPKNAIQSAGWTSEEISMVLNRKNRIISRQYTVRNPVFTDYRLPALIAAVAGL
jgi:hypothetical protein